MGEFVSDGAVGRSPFPPIADYGFLADGHVTALLAPSGSVEWLCLPRMDGPSVFGALLDRDAGFFRIGPADVSVPAARRYLPGTNVIETTWMTKTGWLIVRDALVVGRWHHERERSETYRRSPTDYDAEHSLLRTIKCVQGSVEVNLDCEPSFEYGRKPAEWGYVGEDYSQAVASAEGQEVELTLTSDLRVGLEGRRARARTTLHEGENAFAALSWSHVEPPRTYDDAFERMERTLDYWREWLEKGTFPDHPWRTFLQRSALTLKGLIYTPTGAMIAAATTSLPETPRGERNWDYRFSWIRDSTFMLWGLYTLGFDWEANDFFSFIEEVAGSDHERLQIMYGVGGERNLEEQELDHLSGYEGARPVRIGNAAYRQDQHDAWGAALDSFYLHTKSRDHLPDTSWPILERLVEEAVEHWQEPDRGIWEVRGDPKHFTSSKLMCWVALDRGSRLANVHGDDDLAELWRRTAREIHDDITTNAVDARGVFVQHYDADALDASVLLMPLVRFLPAEDERIRRTVLAVADELTEDGGLVLRYKVDETDDGLQGTEGTFTICSFWLVSALAEIGEVDRARDLCERVLAYASELRLYAEEIDPRTGRHLGNFPQAFTHLALINAVMHIVRADLQLEISRFTPLRLSA